MPVPPPQSWPMMRQTNVPKYSRSRSNPIASPDILQLVFEPRHGEAHDDDDRADNADTKPRQEHVLTSPTVLKLKA